MNEAPEKVKDSSKLRTLVVSICNNVAGIEYLLQSESEPPARFTPEKLPDREMILAGVANVLGQSVYDYTNLVPKQYLRRKDQGNPSDAAANIIGEEKQGDETSHEQSAKWQGSCSKS